MIPPIPLPPPSYEQTVEAIAACGVNPANVRITYEEELESDLVTLSDLGGTDEVRFACLRRSVHPFYILEITPADQRSAYFAYADRESSREWRAEAIAWLEAKQLSDRVPRYDPATGVEAFARAVEAACSVSSQTVLEAFGPTGLTFRQSYIEGSLGAGSDDSFTCVTNMIAASNAEEHGVRLAFVGNEAVGDGPP
jgi:hypothetical protein